MREIDLGIWMPVYMSIAAELGLDIEADRKATALMDKLMAEKEDKVEELELLIKGERVNVLGNGPSLPEHLEKIDGIVIAADAAASVYKRVTGKEPDLIVTDLDGPPEIIKMRSLKVVHAHGDNMDKLKMFVPFMEELVATTQVEPKGKVHNFGGFTDGDRAVFISMMAGARSVILIGMDFNSVTEYDVLAGKDIRRKRKKLEIAKRLIDMAREMGCPLISGNNRA
ncbi:MAG: 6-hydroxymethylpterin diphosphokinase MptE-like protein [Candidatus Methanodesulfokora sp.]